jgi:hypothetical protein
VRGGDIALSFLILAVDVDEWLASRSSLFAHHGKWPPYQLCRRPSGPPSDSCELLTEQTMKELFIVYKKYSIYILKLILYVFTTEDCLCGLVVRVPGYTTEMYCVSCEVRTEFIYVM